MIRKLFAADKRYSLNGTQMKFIPPFVDGLALGIGGAASAAHAAQRNDGLPPDVRTAIESVSQAAAARNVHRLRSLMASEFAFVFRADGDTKKNKADDALAFWRKHPELFGRLARITKAECGTMGEEVVCPKDSGAGFRAVFTRKDGRWVLRAFL